MPQGGGYRPPQPQHHGVDYVSHQQHAQSFHSPQQVSQGVSCNRTTTVALPDILLRIATIPEGNRAAQQ
jgi:hypothetical protein